LIAQTKSLTSPTVERMGLLGPATLTPTRLRVATVASWALLLGAGAYASTRQSAGQEKLAFRARQGATKAGVPIRWQQAVSRKVVDALVATGGAVSVSFLGGWLGMQFV
jgi:hypothetical protein